MSNKSSTVQYCYSARDEKNHTIKIGCGKSKRFRDYNTYTKGVKFHVFKIAGNRREEELWHLFLYIVFGDPINSKGRGGEIYYLDETRLTDEIEAILADETGELRDRFLISHGALVPPGQVAAIRCNTKLNCCDKLFAKDENDLATKGDIVLAGQISRTLADGGITNSLVRSINDPETLDVIYSYGLVIRDLLDFVYKGVHDKVL